MCNLVTGKSIELRVLPTLILGFQVKSVKAWKIYRKNKKRFSMTSEHALNGVITTKPNKT
jgi:hypothetical protein